ncbi:MAG: HlyD family efflux transporter periplasmic adaptor subunit, partial [Betaproteobacteria bacterium]|nr:HlyD family efflux transporter periplasmic adaptor subunit [Betaproteobacteria bacterium]
DGQRDVLFALPEDQLAQVKLGQAVTVKAWGSQATQLGTVHEIAASADPVTRTFSVRVALKDASAPLGSTVSVYLSPHASATQAITLPTTAIRQEAGKTAVWVLDTATMTVKSTPIEVASVQGNEVVVSAGLSVGQIIVAAGVHVLSPGQKVTVFQPTGAKP